MGWFARDEVVAHYDARKKDGEREAAQKQAQREAALSPAVAIEGEMQAVNEQQIRKHKHNYRVGVWAETNGGSTAATVRNCGEAMIALNISTDVFLSDVQEQRNVDAMEQQLENYEPKIKKLQADRIAAKSELELAEQKLAEAKAIFRAAYNAERALERTKVYCESAKSKNPRLWS